MPRTKHNPDPEPTFLGVPCKGPNPKHAAQLRDKANCWLLLATFYELDRREQLITAAAVTEMVKDRGP